MKVYRISHPQYAEDLSGRGAWLNGGRWNPKGTWMLYTAASSSLAILEFLGHVKGVTMSMPFVITQLEIAETNVLQVEDFTHALPHSWASHPHGAQLTQQIGSEWVKSKVSPALIVPSVHTPFESNILINPQHPDLSMSVSERRWYLHDYRLIEKDDQST